MNAPWLACPILIRPPILNTPSTKWSRTSAQSDNPIAFVLFWFNSQNTMEVLVASSKQIAGLLGPVLVVVPISEFPLVQPDLYAEQIPPVVYLSGLLMLIGGLAIVRAHPVWAR